MKYFIVIAAILAVAMAAAVDSSEEEEDDAFAWGPVIGEVMRMVSEAVNPHVEGVMEQIMKSIPYRDLMDTMQETSRAYMIADKEGRCDVLPAKDQMMKGDMAMEMACENAARGDTVCMCASMGKVGMGEFNYELGFTKICGSCRMQLKSQGMSSYVIDSLSFLSSFMESMGGAMGMAPKLQ